MSRIFKKKNLLVIGGTGFIGYHLILAAKKKGWKVTSVSLKKPKKNRYISGVSYKKINIINLKKLKEELRESFTYVVNLGGYVKHSHSRNLNDNVMTMNHFFRLSA